MFASFTFGSHVAMMPAEGTSASWFVRPQNRELLRGFDPKRFTSGTRLCAAMAVATERHPLRAAGALGFRILELSAQALLPAVMLWIVEPLAMAILFILLWYLPAAWHVRSYVKPLTFPLLAFVVDDFSVLGFHPTPRPAKCMYRIMVVRVALLLAVIPLSMPAISPLPQSVRLFFFDRDVWDAFAHQIRHGNWRFVGGRTMNAVYLWLFLACSVFVLSIGWLLMALHMLCVTSCLGLRSPIMGDTSRDMPRVLELSAAIEVKIDETKDSGDEACRQALLTLQPRYPKLKPTNSCSTFGPMMGFTSRLVTEGYSIALFVAAGVEAYNVKGDVNMAARQILLATILGITLAITLVTIGMQNPQTIFREAMRSWTRGVYTEGYLAIVRADKGAQALPALFVKIYGLPFAADSIFSVVVSWGSILGVIGVVSLFTFQQFDLGIEDVGAESGSTDEVGLAHAVDSGTPVGSEMTPPP